MMEILLDEWAKRNKKEGSSFRDAVVYVKNFKWCEPPLVMDKETNMQILSKVGCMEIGKVRKLYPHLPAGWSRILEVQKLSNGQDWSGRLFLFKISNMVQWFKEAAGEKSGGKNISVGAHKSFLLPQRRRCKGSEVGVEWEPQRRRYKGSKFKAIAAMVDR